ncbi:MAG: HAD-IC family P-type ATPase, partial [Firmicutes bacterium]|nr:HAD-IC family P-type ATPase [Bacillota bacterium]
MNDLSVSIKENIVTGLSKEQVIKAREQFGQNLLTKKKRKKFFFSLLENFGDPMIKVLLIALAINIIFLFGNSNWFESLGIAVAVLIAVIVTTVSEYGSEAAFNKLQEAAMNIRCRVIRDGQAVELPINEIVVGDIVLLSGGDRVPADGIIISGKLEVDQSALNGESKEAIKYFLNGENNYKSGDFLNPETIFSGSIVISGEALIKTTAVGDKTYYGKIAAELQDNTPKSPLREKLEKLAKKISVFGYIGAGLVAFSYLFNVLIIDNGFDGQRILAMVSDFEALMPYLINAATLSVTVIVMAVPEGLPMMISVVLSCNMKRMLNDKVFVRKLNGIETAGSMNILFSDKTGTITHGKLSVANIITPDGKVYDNLDFCVPSALSELLAVGLRYNTGAQIGGNSVIGGNATDRALLEYAQKIPQKSANYKVINSVPFSSTNKFMSSAVTGHKNLNLIKGAPEKILNACSFAYQSDGSVVQFINKHAVLNKVNYLSVQAMRIVAVATSKNIVTKYSELEGL